MKLLFDQNLSYRIVVKILEIFPESSHLAALKLDTSPDLEVWTYAREHGYTIVTKDSDFNELTTYYGFPPHVIWLRAGNSSVEHNVQLLLRHAERIIEIINNNETGIIEVLG